MISTKYDKNLARWQKLQEIGEKKAKKIGLNSEEKIVKFANLNPKRLEAKKA